MSEIQETKCKGHNLCKRKPVADGFCEFHLPRDHEQVLSCDAYNALLVKEVKEAVQDDKGVFALHWHGFNFPKGHVLFDFGVFDEVKDRLAQGWFNIEQSNIESIRVGMYGIHQLILSEAIVHGETMIPVTKIDRIIIREARFKGKFHCASKTSDFHAPGAVFDDEFSFGASISERANFAGCRFHKPCIFHGTSGPVFAVDNKVEFKVAGFDGAIFGNPVQTLFRDVDLRKGSFKSVSLVGVRFYNTNFFQKELNRNGLYQEVKELKRVNSSPRSIIRPKPDEHAIKRYRHLIHEYRQLRMAMETSKDYVKAHDFYIGEMEVRQRREWSIVLAIYRLSSYYGTHYGKAFKVLAVLFLLHFLLTIIISTNCQVHKLIYGNDIIVAWKRLGDIVLHSLGTGTLQRVGSFEIVSFWQKLIDIGFRVLIPAQTAMFVLALRNKIKR